MKYLLFLLIPFLTLSCNTDDEFERVADYTENNFKVEVIGLSFSYSAWIPNNYGDYKFVQYQNEIPFYEEPYIFETPFYTNGNNLIFEIKNYDSVSSTVITIHYDYEFGQTPEWGLSFWVDAGKTRYIEIDPTIPNYPIIENYMY